VANARCWDTFEEVIVAPAWHSVLGDAPSLARAGPTGQRRTPGVRLPTLPRARGADALRLVAIIRQVFWRLDAETGEGTYPSRFSVVLWLTKRKCCDTIVTSLPPVRDRSIV
jgi:hypothetical protein